MIDGGGSSMPVGFRHRGGWSPSLSQAEEGQAGEFNRRRQAMSAAVLEVHLHPEWEAPLKEALSGLRVESRGGKSSADGDGGRLDFRVQERSKGRRAKSISGRRCSWRGRFAGPIVPATGYAFTCDLELVGSDQPEQRSGVPFIV